MGSGPGNLAQADKRVGWLPGTSECMKSEHGAACLVVVMEQWNDRV